MARLHHEITAWQQICPAGWRDEDTNWKPGILFSNCHTKYWGTMYILSQPLSCLFEKHFIYMHLFHLDESGLPEFNPLTVILFSNQGFSFYCFVCWFSFYCFVCWFSFDCLVCWFSFDCLVCWFSFDCFVCWFSFDCKIHKLPRPFFKRPLHSLYITQIKPTY